MSNRQKILLLSISDVLLICTTVFFSYLIRFDFTWSSPHFIYLPYVMTGYLCFLLPSLYFHHMYRMILKYVNLQGLLRLLKATTTGILLFYITNSVIELIIGERLVPHSIYFISWAFISLGLGAARFIWKLNETEYKRRPQKKNTLIVGAGSAGVLVAKELKESPVTDLWPIAFADDDDNKQKQYVYGLPVVGKREHIPDIVFRYDVEEIVIAMPSATNQSVADINAICKQTGANVKILPSVTGILHGRIPLHKVSEIKIEDLLKREPVQMDLLGISHYLTDEIILVTGAGGSIGSELCRQIAPFHPATIILLGHGENSIFEIDLEMRTSFPFLKIVSVIADIQDRARLQELFQRYRPTVVFHAAAHKHVPLMEQNPVEAIKNNIIGTINVARISNENKVKRFVLISSDKAVNPSSVMGATKRVAELFIQGLNQSSQTSFVAVRFGNVLGSRGSVLTVFKKQIEQGGPVTVTHPDMVRYFMTKTEAAQLVIQAGALAEGGEIFILDMGNPLKVKDLAYDLIKLSGLQPEKDIPIVYTGIRPGEKMFEELLTSEEGVKNTKHNRIFVVRPIEYSWSFLLKQIVELERIVGQSYQQEREGDIVHILYSILPNYRSGKGREENLNTLTPHSTGLAIFVPIGQE